MVVLVDVAKEVLPRTGVPAADDAHAQIGVGALVGPLGQAPAVVPEAGTGAGAAAGARLPLSATLPMGAAGEGPTAVVRLDDVVVDAAAILPASGVAGAWEVVAVLTTALQVPEAQVVATATEEAAAP